MGREGIGAGAQSARPLILLFMKALSFPAGRVLPPGEP